MGAVTITYVSPLHIQASEHKVKRCEDEVIKTEVSEQIRKYRYHCLLASIKLANFASAIKAIGLQKGVRSGLYVIIPFSIGGRGGIEEL